MTNPALSRNRVRIVDFENIFQRRGGRIRTRGFDRRLDLVPIDALDRVDRRTHFGAALDQAQDLLRLEADIGIDEQQMGRVRVVEELRNQARPRPGDQGIAVLEQDLEIDIAVRSHQLLQLEERRGVEHGNLAAEAGRRDDQIDRVGRGRRRHGVDRPDSLAEFQFMVKQ